MLSQNLDIQRIEVISRCITEHTHTHTCSDYTGGLKTVFFELDNHKTSNCGHLASDPTKLKQLTTEKGLCYKCLLLDHRTWACDIEVHCNVKGCEERHATVNHQRDTTDKNFSVLQKKEFTKSPTKTNKLPKLVQPRRVNCPYWSKQKGDCRI